MIRHETSPHPRLTQSATLTLHPSDVTPTLRPSRDFTVRVAAKVVRGGKLATPGFAVIPNSKSVLGSKARVIRFQRRLVESLASFLRKSNPKALRRQDYLAMPAEEATPHYRRARSVLVELDIDGVTSTKELHMDVLQHLYVSVCYGPNRNVRGGTPLFADLLGLVARSDSLRLRDLVELELVADENYVEELFHPRAQVAMLTSSSHALLRDQNLIRIDGLQFSQLPILLFSNRIEDGIVHGATRVSRKRKDVAASRPIGYVAIAHG